MRLIIVTLDIKMMTVLHIFVGFCLIAGASSETKNVLDVCESLGAVKFVEQVRSTIYLSKVIIDSSEFNSSVTVFAYTDAAYNNAPKAFRDLSFQELQWVLEYHVALGRAANFGPEKDYLYSSLFPIPPDGQSLPLQQIRINRYKILNADLGYHKVVTASGAEIQKADIPASNGVVHIIDKVMYPIPTGSDLPHFLEIHPDLHTLYHFLKNSSIISSLATDPSSPLTIFAPTDAAFDKLTAEQRAKLTKKKKLTKILTYHVIQSALYSAGMFDNQKLEALNGDTILVERGAGGFFVADKKISAFDITVTNGVVHKLSEVMFPPDV